MRLVAISKEECVPLAFEGGPRESYDLLPAIALAAAAVIAIAIQSLWIPIDADVSWLITVAERLLSGDRLYVDIFEVNPPASVWMYVPLVWLANLLGAKVEAIVVAAFVAAGLVSVTATLRLASKLDEAPPPFLLAAVTAFVGLVLPMALFAQREHAALLLALPTLAALAAIAEGKLLGRRAVYGCGMAAGAIVIIKPHFLLAVLAAAIWAARKRQSFSPLLRGIAAAAMVVAAYSLAVLIFARAYLDWLPVIAQTYLPMRAAMWKSILGPSLYPGLCLAIALLAKSPRLPSLSAAWALGSVGFLLAAIIQGKNYPNHWLPQTGLAIAAVAIPLLQSRLASLRRLCAIVLLGSIAVTAIRLWAIVPDPAVARMVERFAPPAPKMIALSPRLTTGHPVTRNVGGHWVGSRAGLFTAAGAARFGLKKPAALRAYRQDIQSFTAEVGHHRPDVILVDARSKTRLMRERPVTNVMSAYRPAGRAGNTEVWLRRTPAD